jgi:hypothetical protein
MHEFGGQTDGQRLNFTTGPAGAVRGLDLSIGAEPAEIGTYADFPEGGTGLQTEDTSAIGQEGDDMVDVDVTTYDAVDEGVLTGVADIDEAFFGMDAPPELPVSETARALKERFDRWSSGETVESSSAPVATLEVTDEDLATLKTITKDYGLVQEYDLEPGQVIDDAFEERTGLNSEQVRVLRGLQDKFVQAIDADAIQNGFGGVGMVHVTVGNFDPEAGLDWHIDNLPYPVARYVVALGEAGSTQFAHGPSNRAQLDTDGFAQAPRSIDSGPDSPYQTVSYETGIIGRFMAGHDFHKTPDTPGFRVFMTASCDVDMYGLPLV